MGEIYENGIFPHLYCIRAIRSFRENIKYIIQTTYTVKGAKFDVVIKFEFGTETKIFNVFKCVNGWLTVR